MVDFPNVSKITDRSFVFSRPFLNRGVEMKTCPRRICVAVFIVAIMVPAQLYAACQIVGTTINGYIVVCDGPDTIGINSGNGSDIITINTGAIVSKTDLQSAEAVATGVATTIDAGNGNNQITNKGSVGANAGATASLKVDTPSKATAKATAIKAGSGADVIQNSSIITFASCVQASRYRTNHPGASGLDSGLGQHACYSANWPGGPTSSLIEPR